VNVWTQRQLGSQFPLSTLVVNVLGCFIIGLLGYAGMQASWWPKELRLAVTVGFLGAFTTFSTFGLETVKLASGGSLIPALGNVAANVLFGIGAVGLGLLAGRALFSSS